MSLNTASSPLTRLHSDLLFRWLCPSLVFRRHEATYRRTKKRLRVKPEASFLSTDDSPQEDHIVFNPPSSAPSIYHTPIKFLPKEDPRRALFSASPLAQKTSSQKLPSPVRKPYDKTYHLTEEDMLEIRRLRKENPDKWTRNNLARKYNCSAFFVGIVAEATQEQKDRQLQTLDAIKARWGAKKTMAREDRIRRRETWGKAEP